MPLAEAAVADNSLGCLFAFFEVATWLARGHGEEVGDDGLTWPRRKRWLARLKVKRRLKEAKVG